MATALIGLRMRPSCDNNGQTRESIGIEKNGKKEKKERGKDKTLKHPTDWMGVMIGKQNRTSLNTDFLFVCFFLFFFSRRAMKDVI